MKITTISLLLFPALAYSLEAFTISGWVPISTIYPTETAFLSSAHPGSLPTNTLTLPSPTATPQLIHGDELEALLLYLSKAGYVPISTIIPTAAPTPLPSLLHSEASKAETSIPECQDCTVPNPIAVEEDQQVSMEEDSEGSHLELRQQGGLGGGAPAAPGASQVSPVTTVWIGTVQVVYSQAFSAVPSQFPSAQAGSIGLGTLTGVVGAVKTQEAASAANGWKGSEKAGMIVGILVGIGVAVW